MSDGQIVQQRVMDELRFDPAVDAASLGATTRLPSGG